MSLISNLGKISVILGLTVTLLTPSFVNAVADTIQPNEESKLLNDKILDSKELIKIDEYKKKGNIISLGNNLNVSKEGNGGKQELVKEKILLTKLSPAELLAVKEVDIDNNSQLSKKQKKVQKQMDKLISKYITDSFGANYTVYNISDSQKNQLEAFIISNQKIIKLYEMSVKNSTDDGNIKAEAAYWETCEWELNFDSWVPYEFKNNQGAKSNWVGRVANEESERSGWNPCDFSFYLYGSPANKVDGWTSPLECAVKWSNEISKKQYGTNNQKMIIGWGRMVGCGVSTSDLNTMRDKVQFYN